MKQALIFWPMFVHAALVFVLYMELGRRRAISAKNKEINLRDFKVLKPESDNDYCAVAARAVANNFEMPVLFHAASLALFSIGAVTQTALVIAWVFIIGRLVQAAILLTYNNVYHRAAGFFTSVFATMALWGLVALQLMTAI
ncbi:MAG: MAPEG family protein [Hyphomicrobiales bacterium]